ncbi:DUF2986 domain-containing protein [Bermanella marisrubri]|uniref:DUF2986 domain-containing protein n=2 Tax=Bermanella marisrubri TaxID=207949 RepID=Q1N2Q7_9GAMM|nr:hypothetical protein RED65_06943 [Oceanobacter sp. RED65] [Bermanella marisrubri]
MAFLQWHLVNDVLLFEIAMNRRKKIYSKLSAKAKKANLRANPKNKPKYISKAERAKLESLDDEDEQRPDIAIQ